jgi:hypothetical protein
VVTFKYYVLPDSIARITDTGAYDWRLVKYVDLKEGFQAIESRFGRFDLVPYSPGDTTDAAYKTLDLRFVNYVNIDSILLRLDSLPFVDFDLAFNGADFIGRPMWYEDVPPEQGTRSIHIWPTPCSSTLNVEGLGLSSRLSLFDELGRAVPISATQVGQCTIIDVSKAPSGVLHLLTPGHSFNILVQK